MLDPKFSESQLQQAVNLALTKYIFEEKGEWLLPIVPSLFREAELGWDTAFYLPWSPHQPHKDHEGCNFFIQYKLSNELTSSGAGQWKNWNRPYLRFKIPHSSKDANGKYEDDYHQWERLRELASADYPTFYATNSILCRNELQKLWSDSDLLHETPCLDVRDVVMLHKYATFTRDSSYFLLHSELENPKKVTLHEVLNSLHTENKNSLSESNIMLYKKLKEIESSEEAWNTDLEVVRRSIVEQDSMPFVYLVWGQLESFCRKHIGVHLYWYPING